SIELVNSGYGAVTVTAGTYAAIVSFLTASIAGLSSGDAVSLCSGEPAQNVISAGKTDTFIVPTDCQYIVIMAMTTSGDQRPVGGFMFYDDHPLVDAAQRITDKAVNDYFPQLNDPVKACILGASIEAGTTHETSTSDAVTNPAKAYLTVALQNNGVTVTNMAHGGMGFLRTASDGTVFKDLIDATDFTEFDSVYISLGSNDWAYNEPLGTTADTGTDTVCGMLKYTLNAIYTAKPSIKVFVIIPCMRKKGTYGDASTQWGWEGDNGRTTGKYSLHDLHDAIKTICDYNFVEVFEDPARGIVNMYNIDTVYPDGTHPTQATMALMAKNMTGRIAMKNAAQAGVSPESVLPGGSGTNNLLRWNTTAAAWLPGADRLPAVTNSDAGKVPTANDQGGYTLQTPESYTLPAATASALGGVKVDSGNSVKADTYGKLTVNEAALNAQHMTSLMVASIFNQDPNIGVLIDDGSMTEEELWGLFETYNMDVIDYAKQAFIFVPAREYDQDHPWHYYDEYYEDKYRTLYAGMLYLIGLNSNNALYFNPIAGDDLRQLLINGIQ
ncbi:MAG: SGNH/GDSL hydrolase family protein, partial [Clostridia bacterium]|nr:SGNH/GDSL hydrolase family protein [Clostridia bacterium]